MLKTKLSPMISEFIFYDEHGSKEEQSHYINLKIQIRDMLREDATLRVASEIVMDLRKDLTGSAKKRLLELFQDLNFHERSYQKLKSWRWEVISKGIEELTQMEVTESYQLISKFLNDKRVTIRKQAELGVVALSNNGIDDFLDTTKHKISEWQQLKLIEVLSKKTDYVPPSFKNWLTSTNKFVVLFALRLIKYYDQNDAYASIIELVKHKDDQIKQEAIACIKSFHIIASIPVLKQIFWHSSADIKIAVLDVIGELGTADDIEFLKSIENKEGNYSVTNKALGAINKIAPESILPTVGLIDVTKAAIPKDLIVPKAEEDLH